MTVNRASLLAIPLILGVFGCHKAPTAAVTPSVTKLEIKDLTPPKHTGKEAKQYTVEKGDLVSVTYKGWLDDGTVFDTNDPKTVKDPRHSVPFNFIVGQGGVIKGWDQGIIGMQLGQTRELTIPPDLGYGIAGQPPKIPPMATLHFDITLQGLVKQGQDDVFDSKDIKSGSGPAIKPGDFATISFTASLVNGKQIIDSKDTGPLTFQVGSGYIDGKNKLAAIGLAYAVSGMKVGGERKITLPPAIGLGPQSSQQGIPPNSIVIFDVTLTKMKPGTLKKN